VTIIELTPSDEGRVVIEGWPRWELSERARREIEAIERRQRRVLATAHLYWFN
jgi:hypothetical protein